MAHGYKNKRTADTVQGWVKALKLHPGQAMGINPTTLNMSPETFRSYVSAGFTYMREYARTEEERGKINNDRVNLKMKTLANGIVRMVYSEIQDVAEAVEQLKPLDSFSSDPTFDHRLELRKRKESTEISNSVAAGAFNMGTVIAQITRFMDTAKVGGVLSLKFSDNIPEEMIPLLHESVAGSESLQMKVTKQSMELRRVC